MMKKLLLISLISIMGFAVFAQSSQQRLVVPRSLQNIAVPVGMTSDYQDVNQVATQSPNKFTKSGTVVTEETIGDTKYDLQTNSATQNRMYVYPDGTMAGVWTRGFTEAGGWSDRGTGYNYFDGTSWGAIPSLRIETGYRTGWPSYSPLGVGEAAVSHVSDANNPLGGLIVMTRAAKGTGTWNQSVRLGPTGYEGLLWPRMVASGSTIHIMALTTPVANGGTVYNGMNGAVLYYRSQDGGATWDKEHVQVSGMTSVEYMGFSGDSYAWAEPKGDTIAFVISDGWYDMILLKSTDGGDNWTKTVVWKHPYPKFDRSTPPFATDTFYCPDGATSVVLDNDGDAHIFFGVNRALRSDNNGTLGLSWFPYVDGIAYWNESMPTWDTDTTTSDWKNILDPDSLDATGHLVAWMLDLNENDTLDLVDPIGDKLAVGWYGVSLTSMPNAHIDENDDIYLVYASINELRYNSDPGKNYRHVFGRGYVEGEWRDFTHITGSLVHNFAECVFPNIAAISDETNVYLLYQSDDEPGMFIRPDDDHQAATTENDLVVATVSKDTFYTVGINEINSNIANVSQNYPNPFSTSSIVTVQLKKSSTLSLQVYDITGRMVSNTDRGTVGAGFHNFTIDGSELNSGIYFYTVTSGKSNVTKKMIVH